MPHFKKALLLTGAAARISQEVALFDKLREPKYNNLTISEDDTLITGFSSGSLNLAGINACFRKANPCDWDAYYKRSLLFPLTSKQVFNPFPVPHVPIYSTHPLRDTLEEFLNNTGFMYVKDLPFQSYVLTVADQKHNDQKADKKWETLWANSRNANQENLYITDVLMSSTAIPVAFPSQEIYCKPNFTTDFPARKYCDGGTRGTFTDFEKYIGEQVLNNGQLDELYIISPMREKSEEEAHQAHSYLLQGLEKEESQPLKNLLSNISMKTFMNFLIKLQDWGKQHFPMAKNIYVCIPEMDENFKILDFDQEERQYNKVCEWVDTHPDKLAVPLNEFIETHKHHLK